MLASRNSTTFQSSEAELESSGNQQTGMSALQMLATAVGMISVFGSSEDRTGQIYSEDREYENHRQTRHHRRRARRRAGPRARRGGADWGLRFNITFLFPN